MPASSSTRLDGYIVQRSRFHRTAFPLREIQHSVSRFCSSLPPTPPGRLEARLGAAVIGRTQAAGPEKQPDQGRGDSGQPRG